MKKYVYLLACLSMLAAKSWAQSPCTSPAKLVLSPAMVTSENGGNAGLLVDEQSISGNPAQGTGGGPTTVWEPATNPGSAYIDLGASTNLTAIYLRDVNNVGNFTVSAGSPGNWTPLFTDDCGTYLNWKQHNVSVTTRYLRFTRDGGANVSEVVIYGCTGTPPTTDGVITYQKWNGISGNAVTDLTGNPAFPGSPSATSDLTSLEAPTDVDDNYGARIVGYLTAPQSGTYYFWVAGDDNVELWLSTTASAANKVKIASHTSWTNSREWNKFTTQKSAGINLTAGTKYYVEALVKEGIGGDNLAAGWRKPSDGNGTSPAEVVPGSVLSRFVTDTQAPTAPASLQVTGKTATSVSLAWTASTDNVGVAGYDVYRGATKVNAANITGTSYTATGLTASTAYTFTVKARDAAGNTSAASNAVSVTTNPGGGTLAPRIPITEAMVTNEVGIRDDRGDFTNLFDEQASITNQAPTGKPVTHWRVGGDAVYYPASLIIDLGQEYDISNIYWFDGVPMAYNGVDTEVKGGKIGIESGAPFNWTLRYEQVLANNDAWHNNATTFRTRYLHIKKHSTATYMWQTYGPFTADAPLMEMVIYGTPVGTPPPPPVSQHTPLNITVDQFMGGNSWWYGDTTTFGAVGHVRAYHDLLRSGSVNLTDPLNIEDYDAFYGRNLTASYEIFPCLQGNADGTVNKPTYGGNSLLPETYRVHADNMWQWAARYGRNTSINPNLMRVLHWQTKKVGLGYLKYIENWNEPNQWWHGSAAHFNPYEFAAMSSADYDGHLGTMGNTVGIKNADPTMKLAMGGLAGPHLDFVKAMKLWSDANRGGSFPADVLNFHHYTQDVATGKGISPEAGDLLGLLQKLVDYRNVYLPGKELWLSEFGWDVEGGSTQQANGHTLWPGAGYTSEDLQAMWLIRGFLIGAKAGIDRMHAYTIGDAGGWGQYATSGMITYNGTKRKSWYYVATMRQRLKGMVCVGEQASGNPNVLIYKFKNKTGTNGVYAIWCPTSNGTTVNNYQLSMLANPSSAKRVTLTPGNASGVETSLTITGNKVTVNVSETPIFVTVSNIDGSIPQHARLAEEPAHATESQEGGFIVYPNPASHSLTVLLKNSDAGQLHLYDLAGRAKMMRKLSTSQTQVDVSTLPKGMYILKVNSGTSADYSKVVIE